MNKLKKQLCINIVDLSQKIVMNKAFKKFIYVLILSFAVLFVFSYIDLKTATQTSITKESFLLPAPGGCNIQGYRAITKYLFPLKEPAQCIWRTEDALINLPYHFLLSYLLLSISNFVKRRISNQ